MIDESDTVRTAEHDYARCDSGEWAREDGARVTRDVAALLDRVCVLQNCLSSIRSNMREMRHTCDNAERWIASRMWDERDEEALRVSRRVLVLLDNI